MSHAISNSNQPFAPAVPAPAVNPPGRYRLVDLGTSPEGLPLLPVALNDAGHVAVYGHPATPRSRNLAMHGYLLRHRRCFEQAVATGGVPLMALSGNDLTAGQDRAEPGGPLQAWASHLGSFGSRLWTGAESCATGINRRGLVAGHVASEAHGRLTRRAFLIGPVGGALYLDPPHTFNAGAMALNDDGTVLLNGACGWFEVDMRTWLWRGGRFQAVEGIAGGGTWGVVLTPQGRVAGRLILHRGGMSAFLHEDGVTRALNPGPGYSSEALAANDQPVVVGRMMDPTGGRHAFRWTAADGMRPLRELVVDASGWSLTKAVAVNASGQIAGVGQYEGERRGFLLNPTD